MLKLLRKLIVTFIPLFIAFSSSAEIRFNGFMSIGAGKTLGNDEVFLLDELTGAEYTNDISFKPDSIFGLQVSSDLGEGLSATAQLVSAGGNNFDPEFEWAYIKYQINPQWAATIGRLRAPFFLHSLYLDVGYTYNWIRPPVEAGRPGDLLKRIEGIDFTWANSYGNWDTTVSLTYGNSNIDAVVSLGPANINFSDIKGITGQVTYDWLTLRTGYIRNAVTVTRKSDDVTFPINEGFRVVTAAVVVDLDPIQVKSEYYRRTFPGNIANDNEGWYISGGYTVGDFTPHITYSGYKNINDNSTPGAVEDYTSITAGLKYNFHPSAVFKIEYITNSVDTTDEAAAALISRGGLPVVEADVIAVAIDLIF